MSRIDLFTSAECPGCPRAREVVRAFAGRYPGVEVHEWDLARDPGPAVGRGIFATPAVLVNGTDILVGVPTEEDLARRIGRTQPSADGGSGARRAGRPLERRLAMPEVDVDARETLFEAVKMKYGFVPNLIREMVRSPAVARVYLDGQEAMATGLLSGREQQTIQLAVSVYNECAYCRAAHRRGSRMAGVSPADVEAIEKGALPEEPRLRSLVAAAWLVLDMRGFLTAEDLKGLEAEGVDRAQLYEIAAIIGLKTISNYVNHIAHTPVDEAFRE